MRTLSAIALENMSKKREQCRRRAQEGNVKVVQHEGGSQQVH